MGKIKKYADGKWKEVANNQASRTVTVNPKLLKEGEEATSVDKVLEGLTDRVDLAEKNIKWLAINGGGGHGGGGGGGGVTEATCTIVVNGQPSGTQGIVLSASGLAVALQDIDVSLQRPWNITVKVNGDTVMAGNASYTNPLVTVPLANIRPALVNHGGTIRIDAAYEDDSQLIYGNSSWEGTLIEAVVDLSVLDGSSTLANFRSQESSIKVNYSVGYLGEVIEGANYRLDMVVTSDALEEPFTCSHPLYITRTTQQSVEIPLTELFASIIVDIPDIESATQLIGVYNIETTLVCLSNLNLKATVNSSLTLVSSTILIASNTMSKDSENPMNISLSGSIPVSFTAYVQNLNIYHYTIDVIYDNGSIDPVLPSTVGYFGQRVDTSVSFMGKSWAELDNHIGIRITVDPGSGTGISAVSQTYYGVFVRAAGEYIDFGQDSSCIIKLDPAAYNNNDNTFPYVNPGLVFNSTLYSMTTQANPLQPNTLSVKKEKSTRQPYIRLSNGAMLEYSDWALTINGNTEHKNLNTLFPSDSAVIKNFTISLCYKADYHADDERTILFCGNTDSEGRITSGIAIDVHGIYLNNEKVYELVDNTINIIDIVCERRTVTKYDPDGYPISVISYLAKVYVDGAITAVRTLDSFLSFSPSLYLGGRTYVDGNGQRQYGYFCDVDIYDFKMYTSAFNDYLVSLNKANMLAKTSYVDNLPDYTKIDDELKKNFCTRRDGVVNSNFCHYDPNTGNITYDISFLFNYTGSTYEMKSADELMNLEASVIGIPILYINAQSASSWTFNNFVQQQIAGMQSEDSSMRTEDTIIAQYWDPTARNTQVLTLHNLIIELQGTSTLQDAVKNINITTPETSVFIPKSHWLPENTYTLKADVVDSSHSCNASIGKFINEQFGIKTGGASGSSYLPFSEDAKDAVYNSDYVQNQQPTATLKHTVEGFPVLLIVNFRAENPTDVTLTALGIYSFNLGRNAYRNLGFKSITGIEFEDKDNSLVTSFPFLSEVATVSENDMEATWIEVKDTTSVPDLKTMDKGNIELSTFDSSKGDFWQNDTNILNNRYEVRYPSGVQPSEVVNFTTMVNMIISLPIEGCCYTNGGTNANVEAPQITGNYPKYTCDSQGRNYIPATDLGGNPLMLTMSNRRSDFEDKTDAEIGYNIESFCKYFCVCLLNGLVDNLGKNMAIRSWRGGLNYAGFYDLDCAFGGSNQGQLDVNIALWHKFLYNIIETGKQYGYVAETYDDTKASNVSTMSAAHSKLWMSLDTVFGRYLAVGRYAEGSTNMFSTTWGQLRAFLDTMVNNYNTQYGTTYTNFADWFVDVYFIPQTGQCGSLLFNYDYKLKYFLQFTVDANMNTKDLTKLHGRRIEYTRNWLKKHILFLDSVFDWRGPVNFSFPNNVNSGLSSTVLNTAEEFPLKTNVPLIIRANVGDDATGYYIAEANTEVWINGGNKASNSPYTWSITNSPNIIALGNDSVKLKDMNVQIMSTNANAHPLDTQGLSALTEIDFSENVSFGDFNIDIFRLNERGVSELRVMDFSYTAGKPAGRSFNLPIAQESEGASFTQFTKLMKIDISNSTCIAGITIPEIPLTSLNVRNSTVQNFVLRNQAYLPAVSLEGCNSLNTVEITNCASYDEFVVANLASLTTVILQNNVNLTNVDIRNCPRLNTVIIENCVNLETITINGCPALVGVSGSDIKLRIQNCANVTSLNLYNNANLETFVLGTDATGLTTLNIAYTKVDNNQGTKNDTNNVLELGAYTALQYFNCKENTSIKYIQFANENVPIPLRYSFASCNSLKRIYGSVILYNSGSAKEGGNTDNCAFDGCIQFSIHGTSGITFNGQNIDLESSVPMPYTLCGLGLNAPMGTTRQTGTRVTNMYFGNTNLNYAFRGTSCTTFDVYYVLSNAVSVTSIAYTFYGLQKTPFWWGNNSHSIVVDNSPNKRMFNWATHISEMTYAFYTGASDHSKYIKLHSPSHSGDTVTDNDGLFSPLWQSLSSMNWAFNSYTYITDRFIFRRVSDSENYNVTGLCGFCPYYLHDTYNNLSFNRAFTGAALVASDFASMGNYTDFFKNMENLYASYGGGGVGYFLNNALYIDYTTINGIPAGCVNISRWFNATYGNGTINGVTLAAMFTTPSAVVRIAGSFRVSNQITVNGDAIKKLNVAITSSFFSSFTNMKYVGYPNYNEYGTSGSEKNEGECSFCGNGVNKYIAQTSFPYDILDPIRNKIVMFAGFFEGCYFENNPLAGTPLPYTMFHGALALQNVAALFKNINFDYSLTSEGFKDSPYLYRVQYLFAATEDASGVRKNFCTGMIPSKLFYHGQQAMSKTFYGVYGNVTTSTYTDDYGAKYTKTSIVVYGELTNTVYYMYNRGGTITWFREDGTGGESVETAVTQADVVGAGITHTYNKPRATIVDIRGCFERINADLYDYESPHIERNEDYCPFNWLYNPSTKQWTSAEKNDYEYEANWEYDGNEGHLDLFDHPYQVLDDTFSSTANKLDLISGSWGAGPVNFCCAPDLLRYCSNTECDVRELFAFAGHNYYTGVASWGNTFSRTGTYGIKGRIPPYLLKPVSGATLDMTNMFRDCNLISGYLKDSRAYVIPRQFFSYAKNVSKIQYTFSGMVFPKEVELAVFNSLNKSLLNDVSYAFFRCYFGGTAASHALVDSVFKIFENIAYPAWAFACYGGESNPNVITGQYITFNTVFASKYGGQAYNSNSNFNHVFAYYNGSTVTHEVNKTMPNTNDNYLTV